MSKFEMTNQEVLSHPSVSPLIANYKQFIETVVTPFLNNVNKNKALRHMHPKAALGYVVLKLQEDGEAIIDMVYDVVSGNDMHAGPHPVIDVLYKRIRYWVTKVKAVKL